MSAPALYAPWMAFPFKPEVLGCSQPPPPPALLPVPEVHLPAPDTTAYHVDDRGQGLLFGEVDAPKRRKKGK